jgi:hypothetical protein
VQVLSDAVGASVWLDEKQIGKTPLAGPIAKQTLGKHSLRVEAKGYLPYTEEVDIRFQKSTRVLVRLAAEEPLGGGTGPATVEVREGKRPWYTSRWMYVGAGVAAVALGAVIGWQLGKDEVISCIGDMRDPRCE